MSISYYKNQLITNLADSTKINYKAYYHNYILFGSNAEPDTGDTPTGYSEMYLTTVAKSSGTIKYSASTSSNTIRYSTNNGTTWSSPTTSVTVNVNNGDEVLWKGELTPVKTSSVSGSCIFSGGTASFDVQGNAMSLLYGDNFKNQTSLNGKTYALYNLFRGANVINAENLILPATTMTDYCYARMFQSCTSLLSPPEFPATTLSKGCYRSIFDSCSSLTKSPTVLPATTVFSECYFNMFLRCSQMTTAPIISATTFDSNGSQHCEAMLYQCSKVNYIKAMFLSTNSSYLRNWVYGVSSSGTFVKNPALTSYSRGTSGIPNNWTVENASS